MSVATDETVVEFLLKKLIDNNNLRNPKYEISQATVKGDGYLGVIHAATITSDDRQIWKVIVKTAPQNEHLRAMTEIEQVFFNEIYFYDTIYPTYLKFQTEKNVRDPFENVPKCLATSLENHKEGLIMENLLEQGYRMWERRKPMNAEHMSLVLKEYGRLHAIGFALKHQKPKLYEELAGKLVDLFEKFGNKPENEAIFESSFKNTLEILDGEGEKEAADRSDKFFRKWKKFYESLKFANMDKYSVITHGDCWCNNMMFKYKDVNDVKTLCGMKILDWQILRVGTPIQDISHVFYTSASKEILDNHKHYLQIYYDSLSSHLRNLGSDPDEVFPLSVFQDHWKRFCPNGLFVSLMMIKLMMSESDEVPDLKDSKNQNLLEAFNYVPKNREGYKTRLKDVIFHFIDNGFI